MHVTSGSRACWRVEAKFPPPRFAISAAGLWGPRPRSPIGEPSLLILRLGLGYANNFSEGFPFCQSQVAVFETRRSRLNKPTPHGIGKIANTLGRGHVGDAEMGNKIDCRPGRAAPAIRPRGPVGNAFPPRGPLPSCPQHLHNGCYVAAKPPPNRVPVRTPMDVVKKHPFWG